MDPNKKETVTIDSGVGNFICAAILITLFVIVIFKPQWIDLVFGYFKK